MAKTLAIVLSVLMFASLLLVFAVFCHGLYARHQMNRYKRLVENSPAASKRSRTVAKETEVPVDTVRG